MCGLNLWPISTSFSRGTSLPYCLITATYSRIVDMNSSFLASSSTISFTSLVVRRSVRWTALPFSISLYDRSKIGSKSMYQRLGSFADLSVVIIASAVAKIADLFRGNLNVNLLRPFVAMVSAEFLLVRRYIIGGFCHIQAFYALMAKPTPRLAPFATSDRSLAVTRRNTSARSLTELSLPPDPGLGVTVLSGTRDPT